MRSASSNVHSRSGSETVGAAAVAEASVVALVVRRRAPGGKLSLPLCLGLALGGGSTTRSGNTSSELAFLVGASTADKTGELSGSSCVEETDVPGGASGLPGEGSSPSGTRPGTRSS